MFDNDSIIFFEGKLYERVYKDAFKARVYAKGKLKPKYRQILDEDHYDYVREAALRKRLNRVFDRLEREEFLSQLTANEIDELEKAKYRLEKKMEERLHKQCHNSYECDDCGERDPESV